MIEQEIRPWQQRPSFTPANDVVRTELGASTAESMERPPTTTTTAVLRTTAFRLNCTWADGQAGSPRLPAQLLWAIIRAI